MPARQPRRPTLPEQQPVARPASPQPGPCQPPLPAACAVTDRETDVIIPPIDPAFPDPLNTVNVSVLNTPNARSEGEQSPGPLRCARVLRHLVQLRIEAPKLQSRYLVHRAQGRCPARTRITIPGPKLWGFFPSPLRRGARHGGRCAACRTRCHAVPCRQGGRQSGSAWVPAAAGPGSARWAALLQARGSVPRVPPHPGVCPALRSRRRKALTRLPSSHHCPASRHCPIWPPPPTHPPGLRRAAGRPAPGLLRAPHQHHPRPAAAHPGPGAEAVRQKYF